MKHFEKVVVIGFDGLEPTIVEQLIENRELPRFAQLRQQGGYARIETTFPAQTPVAWSTFATGLNPGAHGIFDFLHRDPDTYLPRLSLNTYEQKNSFLPPKAVNLRGGDPVWNVLTEAGRGSVILRCPCTYPPDKVRGKMLSGLGVPDLRGGLGTPTFYTTNQNARCGESESLVHVQPADDGTIQTYLIGPRDPKTGEAIRHPLSIEPGPDGVTIRTDGKPREVVVKEKSWSSWLKVKFKMGMLQSARGMVRFYLDRRGADFQLYASPINFDPDLPLFPISSFDDYASDLAREVGDFYTAGMIEEHTGLINGRIDEEAFLAQCKDVWAEREAMMLHELNRFDEGLFFCLYDTPDRLQHMFWRFREPDHPANREHPAKGFEHVIDEEYVRCDQTLGKVLEIVDDRTLLIVLSDHGFNSFQRGMNLNTWLHDQGMLALKEGIRPGPDAGDLLQHVDWSRTQAYALGLGGIYFNLQGREEHGIVSKADVPQLRSAIKQSLTGLQDVERGVSAVKRVVSREDIYHGGYVEQAPDLLVGFNSGYRASWETAMGGTPHGHFEDNVKRWGGDHIIDPEIVPGVLFMNQPFQERKPRMADMAPTILSALGVPTPKSMLGKSLLP